MSNHSKIKQSIFNQFKLIFNRFIRDAFFRLKPIQNGWNCLLSEMPFLNLCFNNNNSLQWIISYCVVHVRRGKCLTFNKCIFAIYAPSYHLNLSINWINQVAYCDWYNLFSIDCCTRFKPCEIFNFTWLRMYCIEHNTRTRNGVNQNNSHGLKRVHCTAVFCLVVYCIGMCAWVK